jgi:hypothetical protein
MAVVGLICVVHGCRSFQSISHCGYQVRMDVQQNTGA